VNRLASVPVYPAAVAGVIVFASYLDADVSLHAAVRSFVLVVFAVACLTAVAVAALGPTRGPLVVTAGILIVRSGDPLHAGYALALVVLVAATWVLARRVSEFLALRNTTRLLNLVSLLLAGATVLTAAVTGTLDRIDFGEGRPYADALGIEAVGHPGRPDIYLILLDGYPRADTLQRLFGFDNSPFLSELRSRGFEIAAGSRSNYMYTTMTLTSMLQMAYVQEVAHPSGVLPSYDIRGLINHNPAWDRLHSLGYQIAANQSPWETVNMRDADLFCGNQVNDFELYLLRTTLLGPIVDAADPPFKGDQRRSVLNQAFDCLAQVSAPTSSPKLVFTHVGAPHLPIVFTRSGEAASRDLYGESTQELQVSPDSFASAYTAEIEYLNARVLKALDRLVSRPDAPVVIVMSDHGSESRLDWTDPSKSDLRERFSNFFAWRTPSRHVAFPQDLTPINLFPILFDEYFDDRIPLREARFFLSPIHNKLEFQEVPDPTA
jgi:hypothetical protein